MIYKLDRKQSKDKKRITHKRHKKLANKHILNTDKKDFRLSATKINQ